MEIFGENILFVVMFVLSLVMSVTFLAALGTYVVRSWRLMGSERDRLPADEEIMDRLDRIEIQLSALSERLPPPDAPRREALPPGDDRPSD